MFAVRVANDLHNNQQIGARFRRKREIIVPQEVVIVCRFELFQAITLKEIVRGAVSLCRTPLRSRQPAQGVFEHRLGERSAVLVVENKAAGPPLL